MSAPIPPAATSGKDGVLAPDPERASGAQTPSESPEVLEKAAIERLGRQRPQVLSSAFVEIAYLATIVISMMMSEYFISGFFLVLPPIADDLAIPESVQTWPAGVINLTTAAFLLPCARFCDRFGARVVFLSGHVWLVIWSIIAGFSTSANLLIVSRAMQGLGASAFIPAGLALIAQTYRPGPRKNLVFSIYGAFACVGFYIGIFVGGLSVQFITWSWFFWIGAILSAIVAGSGLLTIPKEFGVSNKAIKMDWLGLVTIVPGLILVVFAFTDGGHAPDGWATPYIYVTLIIGVLFLCAAVYVEGWVAANPLLPAEMFRPKGMRRLVCGLFCCYGVFGLYLYFATFYLERVLHTTPIQTAAWFTPMAVGGMFLAICGGIVLHMLSGRILMIISGVGFLLCCLLFAVLPVQEDGSPSTSFLYWAYVFPAMLCSTIGVDITFNVTNIFITTSMPARLQATASGLINSILYLAIAFWLGIGEMAVSLTLRSHEEGSFDVREQYRIGFWTGVGLSGLAMCFIVTVSLGRASAEMTADEKAELEAAARSESQQQA